MPPLRLSCETHLHKDLEKCIVSRAGTCTMRGTRHPCGWPSQGGLAHISPRIGRATLKAPFHEAGFALLGVAAS